jgi:hypothetical protein
MIRKSTYAGRRTSPCRALGRLDGDSSLIAKRVQQLACTAVVVVWAHEDMLFAVTADSAAKIPADEAVGAYRAGVLLAEIEDDLRRFRSRGA